MERLFLTKQKRRVNHDPPFILTLKENHQEGSDSLFEFLSRFETDCLGFRDINLSARLRVAPLARLPRGNLKTPESGNQDLPVLLERLAEHTKYGIKRFLCLGLLATTLLCQFLHHFCFRHYLFTSFLFIRMQRGNSPQTHKNLHLRFFEAAPLTTIF